MLGELWSMKDVGPFEEAIRLKGRDTVEWTVVELRHLKTDKVKTVCYFDSIGSQLPKAGDEMGSRLSGGVQFRVLRVFRGYPGQLGPRLRALRESASLTVADLAERTGLNRTYLHALEAGTRQPSLDVARKLAVALSVSLSEFD